MTLNFKEGDLFTPHFRRRVLVHSVNCKGVWGSGIAKEFKARYPDAFKAYATLCKGSGKALLGQAFIIYDPAKREDIACLFVSDDYGKWRSPQGDILRYTKSAVEHLLNQYHPVLGEVHSPKINSGLFGVPWEQTGQIITQALSHHNHAWSVWTPKGAL